MRGTTGQVAAQVATNGISIHVPLAGHDILLLLHHRWGFISIHVPLAGHDLHLSVSFQAVRISIHVPLAGHDLLPQFLLRKALNFNPRAPCGARQKAPSPRQSGQRFQSTCPLRGTTRSEMLRHLKYRRFQSTCPLRGTTQIPFSLIAIIVFQSTCPLRGTTEEIKISCCGIRISIHVPLAGHDGREQHTEYRA